MRLLLAMVFAVAGVAKLFDRAGSRKSMDEFGVPAFLAGPLAVLVPAVELACAAALIPAGSAWWGASGALALLLVFIAVITVSLVRGRRPACHCFGQLSASPVGWTALARNAVLAALAFFVVWQGQANLDAGVVDWLGGMSRSASLMLGLALAVTGLAAFELWALVHLLRQNGRLLLRLEAIEGKVGAGTEAPPQGLPVDTPASVAERLKTGDRVPSLRLPDLGGRVVDLARLHGRRTLLLFWNPSCGFCRAMLGDVKTWERRRPPDAPQLLVISAGSSDAAREQGFRSRVLLDAAFDAGRLFGAEGTPSAVVLDEEGRVASLVGVGASAVLALAGAVHERHAALVADVAAAIAPPA